MLSSVIDHVAPPRAASRRCRRLARRPRVQPARRATNGTRGRDPFAAAQVAAPIERRNARQLAVSNLTRLACRSFVERRRGARRNTRAFNLSVTRAVPAVMGCDAVCPTGIHANADRATVRFRFENATRHLAHRTLLVALLALRTYSMRLHACRSALLTQCWAQALGNIENAAAASASRWASWQPARNQTATTRSIASPTSTCARLPLKQDARDDQHQQPGMRAQPRCRRATNQWLITRRQRQRHGQIVVGLERANLNRPAVLRQISPAAKLRKMRRSNRQ